MKPNKTALLSSCPVSEAFASRPVARPALKPAMALRCLLAPRAVLTLGLMAACAALGVHPAHAAGGDTGVPDTYTLDSGAFQGVVTGAGTYLNDLIKNFGVPAILVSLAVSGWMFVRHIAKGAFH